MIVREELRRLCEVATPGPWYARNLEYGLEGEDAEFSAAARTAVPALLDALEAAEAHIAKLHIDMTNAGVIAKAERQAAEAREKRLREAAIELANEHRKKFRSDAVLLRRIDAVLAENAP